MFNPIFFWSDYWPVYEERLAAMTEELPGAFASAALMTLVPKVDHG
jgi:hypothetical protein